MDNEPIKMPEYVTCEIIRENSVVICDKCNGLGTIKEITGIDYVTKDHAIRPFPCSKCKGDGRMIEMREYAKIHYLNENVNTVPYKDFIENTDPYFTEIKRHRYKIDRRTPALESIYPDLKDLSYDKYDELLEKYKLVELLKK